MQIAIFAAVFGASMSGAQLLGVSLNKIVLLPLLTLLLLEYSYNNGCRVKVNKFQWKLIALYLLSLCSCLYGLITNFVTYEEYTSRLVSYAIQSLIMYVPIFILLCNNSKNKLYYNYFTTSLIWTCRVQGIWGFVQFFLYYGFSINLNVVVFEQWLKGILDFEGGVLRYSYENGTLGIRLAGLNSDPAYLCILLILGIIFERNKIFKYLYGVVMLLTLSRVGVVVLFCLFLRSFIFSLRNKTFHVKISAVIKIIIYVVAAIVILLLLYYRVPYFRSQIDYFVYRITNLFTVQGKNQSSVRHSLYIPYSIMAYITELDPIQKLIGVGLRVTTVVFASNRNMASVLQFNNTGLASRAAAIECDIAEILLGTGIVGFYLYYSFLYQVYRSGDERITSTAFAFVIYGVMYDISSTTLIQIVLWFMCVGVNGCNNQSNNKEKITNDVYNNA